MTDWSIPIDKLNDYLTELNPVYHNVGRSIIMPSGSGKSYWMKNLQDTTYGNWKKIPKHSFIDSDPLMIASGAMPPLEGENLSGLNWKEHMKQICERCDMVTVKCKEKGLWLMGATWWDPTLVDAFVVLPEELNKKYLKGKGDVGEGFNENYYERELKPYIENNIRPLAKDFGVPIFDSIESCAMFIIRSDNAVSSNRSQNDIKYKF